MSIEFSVGNYLSFKETVTFSMVAAKLVAKDKTLDENNVFSVDDDLSLLKSAAIYHEFGQMKGGRLASFDALPALCWSYANTKQRLDTKCTGFARRDHR